MFVPRNIAARRAEEDRLAAARAVVAQGAEAAKMATFEIKTDVRIRDRMARDRVEAGKRAMAESLNRRRTRLAALLEDERRRYEAEIEASFETPEQAKARMFARARELQAKREQQRLDTLKELEKKRWRQQSDLLRARDSKLTVTRTAEERAAQLEEADRLAAQRAEEERKFADEWERNRLARAEREERERAERAAAAASMKEELDAMVTLRNRMREAEKHKVSADEAAELDQWRQELAAAEERVQRKKQLEREEHARTMAMNERYAVERAREAAKEFDEDKARLQATLDREAAEERAEREAAAARKAEAQAHRAALVKQMAIEAEETSHLDEVQRQFEEAMWKKRQDQWDAEAAARSRLMEEVHATRKAQMRERDERATYEAELARRDAEELKARIAAEDEAERRRAEAAKGSLLKQQEHVRKQMEAKERAHRAAKQQEYLEVKLMKKEEAAYTAKVDELLKEPAPATQFRRKKAQWYY